jgi:hypothetical protein
VVGPPGVGRHGERTVEHRPLTVDDERFCGKAAILFAEERDRFVIRCAGVGHHDVIAGVGQPERLPQGLDRSTPGAGACCRTAVEQIVACQIVDIQIAGRRLTRGEQAGGDKQNCSKSADDHERAPGERPARGGAPHYGIDCGRNANFAVRRFFLRRRLCRLNGQSHISPKR